MPWELARGTLSWFQVIRLLDAEGIVNGSDVALPDLVREECRDLPARIGETSARIEAKAKRIAARAQGSRTARRLRTMPGIGPMTALCVEAFAPALATFRCGRDVAAWLGRRLRLVSAGGKHRLGRVPKAGQVDPRWLLIIGAMAGVIWAGRSGSRP